MCKVSWCKNGPNGCDMERFCRDCEGDRVDRAYEEWKDQKYADPR